eukprot:TRINITY_DN15292_c0_g1_i2.p1 TRINITY_DN15292_c0_g1~~TRINITY_DN15292_c0_g1_i2.p1  ORF type:complete len:701 (+),score=190.24 TRINITY_DN15292_c0_g1_i2:265-2367(+)
MGCQSSKAIVESKTLNNFDTRSRYSHKPVEQDFHVDADILGKGLNGTVTKALHRKTGQAYALKVLQKKGLSDKRLDALRAEVNNYLLLDHPHIARLLHVYEDEERVCLIMELCAGKELFDRLLDKKQFIESEALDLTYQMVLAINYIHSRSMVHCDLKLENFLLDSLDDNANIKLIDFGFSKKWTHTQQLKSSQGTMSYTAPEVFLGKYTDKCDMWSLGVVVFMLLGGHAPFSMKDEEKCQKCIMAGSYHFREDRWKNVSDSAKDFVRKLLCVNADRRMSAHECLCHPWLLEKDQLAQRQVVDIHGEVLFERCTSGEVGILDDLRNYAQSTHLRRAVLAMMAHHLVCPDMKRIQKTFLSWDTDRTGTISRSKFRKALKQHSVDLTEEEMTTLFNQLNISHDEEIHYSEFIAAVMVSKCTINEEQIREAYNLFDGNGRGYVTAKDLKRVFGGSKFEQMDIHEIMNQCEGCSHGITYDMFAKILRDESGSLRKCPSNASVLPATLRGSHTLHSAMSWALQQTQGAAGRMRSKETVARKPHALSSDSLDSRAETKESAFRRQKSGDSYEGSRRHTKDSSAAGTRSWKEHTDNSSQISPGSPCDEKRFSLRGVISTVMSNERAGGLDNGKGPKLTMNGTDNKIVFVGLRPQDLEGLKVSSDHVEDCIAEGQMESLVPTAAAVPALKDPPPLLVAGQDSVVIMSL